MENMEVPAEFNLANFMRSHLYSAMAALKIGNDILLKEEQVKVESCKYTIAQIIRKAFSDCGGLMAYNYYSGEPVTGMEEGRPMFVRTPDARFSLANFMRSHLYSAMAALKIGICPVSCQIFPQTLQTD